MIEWFAFAGMILGAFAGMFGAYALGFYDGVKDGESDRSLPRHAAANIKP
jgi:hypothetical protein